MYSVPVIVLLLVEFCLSFPAVAGDCYDDPPNNGSYDNCNTCYQTLANALINTKDNKYNLGKTFFPDNSVKPAEVTVEYLCISASDTADTNCTTIINGTNCTDTTWYWLKGEFLEYQPLDLFMYRSLFFSPSHWRQKSVQLYLPHQCFICSNTSDDFFGYLTQRLNLFAATQSATGEVSDMYMGRAIKASHSRFGDDDILGNVTQQIIPAVYVVPFSAVCALLGIPLVVLCLYEYLCWCSNCSSKASCWDQLITNSKETLKEFKSKLSNNLQVQANLAAITLFCCLFSIYAFVLDILSLVEEKSGTLPQYYHKDSYGFYEVTLVLTLISFLFDAFGMAVFFCVWLRNVILSIHWCKGKCSIFCSPCISCCKRKQTDGSNNSSDCFNNSCCKEVYIPMLFCIVSAILSLSFHFQNILIAWSTDPFYASRIALFYGIIIFGCFVFFKYAYIIPLTLLRGNNSSDHWKTCELITVVLSLFFAIVLFFGPVTTLIFFMTHTRINNSIEQSVTGISTIFNGAVILIGGIVAYSVGIRYFGNRFSLEDALKNAMGEIKTTPFKSDNNGNWSRLTEEGRMTEVMKTLIHRETSNYPPYKDPSTQPSSTSPTQPSSTSQTKPSSGHLPRTYSNDSVESNPPSDQSINNNQESQLLLSKELEHPT